MHLVITGATKGIGLSIVELFAEKGYDISFCARNKEEVDSLVKRLTAEYPDQHFYGSSLDVTDVERLKDWGLHVSSCGSVDVLINNAGVYIPGNISDEKEGQLESQLQVNLLSAYHLTRCVIPKFIEQGKGYIFNMCSIASLKAYPGGGSYSISKYALLGFSDNLRFELQEKGIKVIAVLPGATWSNSWAGSGISQERIMESSDIAEMIYATTQLSSQAVVERIVMRPQLGDL